MKKKPTEPTKDINETAFSIVQQATGQAPKQKPPAPKQVTAVIMGKEGKQRG